MVNMTLNLGNLRKNISSHQNNKKGQSSNIINIDELLNKLLDKKGDELCFGSLAGHGFYEQYGEAPQSGVRTLLAMVSGISRASR